MNSKETFLRHLAPTSNHPVGLEVDVARGSVITDRSGKEYIDLIAGIAVSSLGHQHEGIITAVNNQMKRHSHVMVYGEYIQETVNNLAVKLAELLPEKLSTSYFVNSGAEANEAAVKLAKRITGRHEVIAFQNAYHGNTMGAMSFSANEVKKQSFRPLIPGTRFIPFNDLAGLTVINKNTAAVIIEPIQGDAGVVIPSQTFMRALREKCDETGAVLIFDEVQTGIGRTGKMFAFEHLDIIPDIITLAKGLGGGLPIGAFISSYDKMRLLADNPMLGHITTFGGNPVSCAAAGVVVDTISQPAFLKAVEAKGRLFEEQLKHKEIKDLRRKGLMLAIELESEEKVNKAIELALDSGVIIYWFLSTRNAFRISPPLNISEGEIIVACQRLKQVFAQL